MLHVQKSVKLYKTWQNLVKLGKKGVNPNLLVAALGGVDGGGGRGDGCGVGVFGLMVVILK